MEFHVSENSVELTKSNKRKQVWYKVVSVLASVVVFCTTYALILPAITMSEQTFCGYVEHTHTELCYQCENIKTYACDASPHQHDENCYDSDGMLICDAADYFAHSHSEICYDDDGQLICQLEEVESHQHTEDCYQVENMDEDEDNDKDDDKDNERGKHKDNDDKKHKRPVEKILVCGKLSTVEHVHTEDCFRVEEAEDKILVCELEEHTHELICNSDKTADVETAEIWAQTVPSAEELSGVWTDDLVKVAKTQIGYKESPSNFEVDENGNQKGYTRYGQWYGEAYKDWDVMFVSFCLNYAQIPDTVIPHDAEYQSWKATLRDLGVYKNAEEYEPLAGDIVFLKSTVGIVTEVSDAGITVIEGNSDNSVKENIYSMSAETENSISGYGSMKSICGRGVELGVLAPSPDVEEEVDTNTTDSSNTENEGVFLKTESHEMYLRLEAAEEAFSVPVEELTLSVKEPDADMQSALMEALGDEIPYYAVDIQILNDGEAIQPASMVEIVFDVKNDPLVDYEEIVIYYAVYDKENNNLTAQEVEGERNSDGDVVMRTDHFSTYVVTGAETESGVAMYATRAATPTNTWQEALTDRSNNVGVTSEGYTDSPYDFEKEQPNLTNIWTTAGNYKTGGTFFLKKKCNQAEKYWDGSKPFRITSASEEQAELWFSMYSDLVLEDNDQGAPYGALKIDNVSLLTSFDNPDIHARGNKLVIGENVTTNPTKRWRIFGGATQYDANDEETHSNTNYITNVIVNSGTWAYVYGGGLRDTNHGTQVTIRNEAVVGTVYGGGRVEGDINNLDNLDDVVNIYIEGGTVGEVFGGSETEKTGLKVNGDIKIDVSGGHVGTIYAGNDHRKVEGTGELEGSKVRGGAVVNIYNTGSVGNVVGDYTHYDTVYGDQTITFKGENGNYSTPGRHIQKLTELNIHSNNNFGYMDYWDIVRINNLDENATPNSVNVTSNQGVVTLGDRVINNIGSEYIGRIEVTNGGRFYVKDNCFINYRNEVSTSRDGVQSFELNHAWQGESTEERRAWSTLAVEGSCIEPSTAATNLFTLSNPCDGGYAGLRIKGNVEGFSVLEACGEPMYSTGDTYYYYVVADSSDNGGKAFREPEGAPYVVCYRYLDDGRIGWYLRERPVLTIDNSLVRVGTDGTLTPTENGVYTEYPSNYVVMHVDMKGFAYEWSSTPGKNRVEFEWTIFDGYENVESTTGGISIQTMADIANNIYSTSNPNGIFANVKYDAMGSDEGSSVQTKRVSSFDVIIDTSKAVQPRYYDVSSSFHYTRGEDNYDDLRVGQTADAARCTYDFDKEEDINEGLPYDGYANSIMTTYEYKDGIPPKGADDALLRVYLPEGVSANTLTVEELDEQFTFEKTGIAASLVSNSQVAQYYSTEEESTYNHKFGVTLQQTGDSEIDLAGGATLNNLSGKETYQCAVYSHEKINFTDITPESDLGLQLQLQLNSLTKGGNAVGNGNPSAVNDGELRIQVYPVGTILETTTITVKKVVEGANPSTTAEFEFLLSYPKLNENGQNVTHEERFTLEHNEEKTVIVPLETEITIQEINHDGYYVQTEKNSEGKVHSDTVSITTPDKEHLTGEELKVTFYNTPGVELPSTGGIGTLHYSILGLLLMLGATALLWMHRQERRNED